MYCSFLTTRSYESSKPKAYVNWVLLDEQFHYVSASSGYEQVGGDNVFTVYLKNDLPLQMNGEDQPANRMQVHDYTDDEGMKREKIPLEEAMTLGIVSRPPSPKTGTYPSENSLRAEQGDKKKRVAYTERAANK